MECDRDAEDTEEVDMIPYDETSGSGRDAYQEDDEEDYGHGHGPGGPVQCATQ